MLSPHQLPLLPPTTLLLQVWPGDQKPWQPQGACEKCRTPGPTTARLNQDMHFHKVPQGTCVHTKCETFYPTFACRLRFFLMPVAPRQGVCQGRHVAVGTPNCKGSCLTADVLRDDG